MAQLRKHPPPPPPLAKSPKNINPKIQAFKRVLNWPVSNVGAEWAKLFSFRTGFQILAI